MSLKYPTTTGNDLLDVYITSFVENATNKVQEAIVWLCYR